jgi:hypothetical protein
VISDSKEVAMKHSKLFVSLGAVAATGLALAGPAANATMKSTMSEIPPAQHAGPVTYVSGGGDAVQADALQRQAAKYPLEFDFLWGRGAKETAIANVDWSLKNDKTGQAVDAHSTGPMVLASLPDGHYTVTATYDGKTLSRDVDVQRRKHDQLLLEWPE